MRVIADVEIQIAQVTIVNSTLDFHSSFDESPITGSHMADERKTEWKTLSGINIPRTFSNADTSAGQPPYTAGIHETMYRSRLWTMRQYAGFSSAKETNERFKLLLDRGQKGLSVAFDLPTQLGLDADDELSIGEVGKVGVSISTLDDMRELFSGIPLDKVSTSMTINAPAMILLGMYIVVAEEQGVPPNKIRGTIQNDILKEYMARGTYVFPPDESMRLITDIFSYCSEQVPLWNTISISGYHIREAGCTATQEVAFTLSSALNYIDAAIKSGLEIDQFAPRLSFFFNCHNDFFEEVAKFRAARKLWHDLVDTRYESSNPKSKKLRFHTQVAGVSLTAQQPLNNISRVTIQALAAVCGGTQSLHTNSYDEAIGLPTEDSATIALRTQQIIAEESGAADVIDPLGGSYYIEHLTAKIYEEALSMIEEIDSKGGAMEAIKEGWQQRQIHNSAYSHLKDVESGKRKIVGVNHGVMEQEDPIKAMKLDDKLAETQRNRLASIRERRNNDSVVIALQNITNAAESNENLFPLVLDAIRCECTLGEIMQALKKQFGTWMAPSGF